MKFKCKFKTRGCVIRGMARVPNCKMKGGKCVSEINCDYAHKHERIMIEQQRKYK